MAQNVISLWLERIIIITPSEYRNKAFFIILRFFSLGGIIINSFPGAEEQLKRTKMPYPVAKSCIYWYFFLKANSLNQMTAHDLQLPWQKESFITLVKDLKKENLNPLATGQQIEKSLQIITYFKQILWLWQHLQMGGLGNVAPPYLSFCFADNLCAWDNTLLNTQYHFKRTVWKDSTFTGHLCNAWQEDASEDTQVHTPLMFYAK